MHENFYSGASLQSLYVLTAMFLAMEALFHATISTNVMVGCCFSILLSLFGAPFRKTLS
jgi:hypothetical protein